MAFPDVPGRSSARNSSSRAQSTCGRSDRFPVASVVSVVPEDSNPFPPPLSWEQINMRPGGWVRLPEDPVAREPCG